MSHIGQADDAPTAVETLDRKELLTEQFNEVEKAAADVAPAPAAAADRPRDESGKFTAKPKADAGSATAAAAAPTAQVEPSPVPEPWAAAPKSWKKELAAGWGQLDPTYQRYVHEREDQMRAGIEPLLPRAQLGDAIAQVAEPYMNTIRGLGLELPQAVGALMNVDHQLRVLPYEQKLQVLAQVAASYGIDLTGQVQAAQQSYPPQVQALQSELINIKGEIQNYKQQQAAAMESAALAEIQGFAKTAEHFEEARPVMIQLLQSGMAEGIEDAYHKAIRLDPDLFEQISNAQQATAAAQKSAAADAAAKKAKAAAVSVKTATPGSKTPTKAQDRRSMLIEQFDSLSERL